MDDEGVDAVGLEFIELPADLLFAELIVPEPERGLGELPAFIFILVEHATLHFIKFIKVLIGN